MLRTLVVLGLVTLAIACDEDGTCSAKPLDDLCDGDCPETPQEAIASICNHDGGNWGSDGWLEIENGCGGTTIETRSGPWGGNYAFDRSGKLVGALRWSDTTDGPCNSFDTYYGRKCSPGAKTEHDCSGTD